MICYLFIFSFQNVKRTKIQKMLILVRFIFKKVDIFISVNDFESY